MQRDARIDEGRGGEEVRKDRERERRCEEDEEAREKETKICSRSKELRLPTGTVDTGWMEDGGWGVSLFVFLFTSFSFASAVSFLFLLFITLLSCLLHGVVDTAV
jgi:hypothetical protein